MTTKQIATISFTDGDSGGEALVAVRQCGEMLALAVSLREDGDIQVLLDAETARHFADAIRLGVESIASASQ